MKWAALAALTLVLMAMANGKKIRAELSKMGEGWSRLHPDVKARALAVLEEANAHFSAKGLQVGIFEGWRDVSEQLDRMASGASTVRDPLRSYHPWGLAVDFVFLKGPGLWTWDPDNLGEGANQRHSQSWQELGEIIRRHGFEWGGDWVSLFDGPHAQLPAMRTSALVAQYDKPEEFITWG